MLFVALLPSCKLGARLTQVSAALKLARGLGKLNRFGLCRGNRIERAISKKNVYFTDTRRQLVSLRLDYERIMLAICALFNLIEILWSKLAG